MFEALQETKVYLVVERSAALVLRNVRNMSKKWDPTVGNERGTLSSMALSRIKADLLNIFTEPPPGIFVVGDESNLKIVHALILGVKDTPYEGGFFYFLLKCPNDYPMHPPKVKLMTTDAGRVRFNPNLYNCGKVCLSILGTWVGPAWSPAQQLSSLLLSIQSLMNDQPYFNEPGFFTESKPGEAKQYNEYIQHETLRAAVCGMLENECHLVIPEHLCDIMEKTFLESYDQYVSIAKKNLHLDGRTLVDLHSSEKSCVCQYKSILQRLKILHKSIQAKNTAIFKVPQTKTVTAATVEATSSQEPNVVDADRDENILQQRPSRTKSSHSNSRMRSRSPIRKEKK